jgi:hypothetical protein
MAKKNIEDPEEGTPNTQKTKKEIRQERRQMKSINAGREEMGGEKLYSKKEIRDVKKPFEPKASDPLTGTKQGTTYNDPNKPAQPDYEYQKTGLSSRMGDREVVKATPITAEQFTALNADDPNTGSAIKKAMTEKIVADPKPTLQEKEQLLAATNVVEKEVDKTREGIDNQVKKETTTQTNIPTTDPNAAVVGGSGATVAGITGAVDPNKQDWTLSEPAIEFSPVSREDIYNQAREAKVRTPQLAIEKLGLQDYYPEAGRNIAVGTFTGSRIGSQTIYSGAGGLLPLGLYDARKRAIAGEIKKKEAIMDQLKEIPDIAKQFKTEYSQQYMEFLSPWLNAFKDKPEALTSNTDFLKEMAHYKSVAENFLKVDSDLKEFEALVNPGDKGAEKGGYGAYATPAMLEILHKFKSGFLPGKTTDWLTGKKNISKLTETVQAIPNGYKVIGDQMKVLLANDQVERVIKPKEGEEVDWTKAKQEIDGIAQQVKDGSSDYESYLTVVKKYYDIDTRTLAEQFVKGNSLNALTDKEKEEYINSLSLFADAQIPEASMIAKVDRQNNDNASRYAADVAARTAANRLAFDKEQATFDRENSQVLKDVQNLLSDNKTSSTVQHKGVETSGNGLEYNYHVIMNGTNTTKRYTGAQILELQRQGRTFTGNDGKTFNVPQTVTIQPYQTTYTKSGSRVIGRTRINAYTAGGTEEEPTSKMVNAVIDLPEKEYTNADGSFNTAAMTESDVYNYNKSPGTAAQGTEGGKTGTSKTTYKRNP